MILSELFEYNEKNIIYEGLKEGDLRDLVSKTISIDQFYGKIKEDNIVMVFYVSDEDPAHDLCNFLDKSEVRLLDTDVSSIPNENGKYLVFVEFIRDDKFPKRCISLVESVKNLTKIYNWKFKTYRVDKKLDLSKENIKKYVRLDSKENQDIKEE